MTRRWTLIVLLVLATCVGGGLTWRAQRTAARRMAAWDERQQDEAIITALDKMVALEPGTITLDKFAANLAEKAGVEIVIDVDALSLSSSVLPSTSQVEIAYERLPASSHLALALQALDLVWIVERGQVVITTPEKAENARLTVVTYPLPQPDLVELRADARQWADIITSVITPSDWDDVGGPGHCEPAGGSLIIAHRPEVQRQIKSLFARLKAAGEEPRSWQPVPIWPEAAGEANKAVLAALARPASIDCREMPLDRLLQFLSTEHQIPLVLNSKKLADSRISRHTPVTAALADMSLASLLTHVARELELTLLVRDGAAQLATPEDAESQLVLVAYPVHDLLVPPEFRGLGPDYRDYDSLLDLIVATIRPDSWDDVGGPASIDGIGGWLLIPQTRGVHVQLERLLRELRGTLDLGPVPPLFTEGDRKATEARIFAALAEPIAGSYYETRLRDVCEDIGKQLQIPVRISHRKLEEASVSPDVRITLEAPTAPASIQLRRLLEPQELTYVVRNEALIITTPEDAESELVVRVYDVRALHESDVGLFATIDYDPLIDLVTSHISSDSWDDVGGPGAIEMFRGVLVVSQTPEAHDQLAALLAELRRALRWGKRLEVHPASGPSAAEERIWAALDAEIAFEFEGVPLAELCRELKRRLGVFVYLDEKRLREASFDSAAPITCRFPAASGRVQLARLCDMLELEFGVRNDLLTLTAAEAADGRLTTRIYDVRSLWDDKVGLSGEVLEDAIVAHIEPDSWDVVGGAGHIGAASGVLVVTHTWSVHEQVGRLLDQLRTATAAAGMTDSGSCAASRAEAAIEAVLERQLPLRLALASLADLPAALGEVLGVPVYLDQRRLEEAGILLETPVVCDWPAAPAHYQLRRVCDAVGIDFAVRDDWLVLTTPTRSAATLRTCVYGVGQLQAAVPELFAPITAPPGMSYMPGHAISYDALGDDIIRLIHPISWDDVGGVASITSAQNVLIVSQTAAGHAAIQGYLTAVATHCSAKPPAYEPARAIWTLPGSPDTQLYKGLATRLYSVGHLARNQGESSNDLLNRIIEEVETKSWADAGGNNALLIVTDGWLAVTADLATHEALQGWIEQQRQPAR